jgi:uridine kinase
MGSVYIIITGKENERYNRIMNRDKMIQEIATTLAAIRAAHPLRVAVDGVDASGKTRFADELALALAFSQRQVIRASVDGFHQPSVVRRQKGALSPEGFYQDSYNYPAFISNLLSPLSPNGNRRYRTAVFDLHQDRPIQTPWQNAADDAILIVDGIFLLRNSLLPFWDIRIYLHAEFANTVPRGAARDQQHLGSHEEAARRYWQRYVPGQKIYFKESHPLDKADILIDNNNLDDPEIIRNLIKTTNSDWREDKDRLKWRNL